MRETYFLELLMKMVRAGMKSPVFKLPGEVELVVYSDNVEIAIPVYKTVDSGNATHEEIVSYQSITLTADQLSGMMGVAYGLCMSVSELEKGEKG